MGRPKFKAIKTGGQVTHDPRVGELGAKQSSSRGGSLVCERSRDGRKPKKKEYFVVTLGIWRQDLDSQREGGSSLWSQTDWGGRAEKDAEAGGRAIATLVCSSSACI